MWGDVNPFTPTAALGEGGNLTTPWSAPMTAAPANTHLTWKLTDDDRYRVERDQRPVGYIEVVGECYVVLHGGRYSRAVEIAQTREFERAVRALEVVEQRDHRPGMAA